MTPARRERPSLKDAGRRIRRIIAKLRRRYPEAHCALDHQDPLELLVATILSAQCTDERVNLVTKDLFQKYRTAADYADANSNSDLISCSSGTAVGSPARWKSSRRCPGWAVRPRTWSWARRSALTPA